jgi:hypothetical protein
VGRLKHGALNALAAQEGDLVANHPQHPGSEPRPAHDAEHQDRDPGKHDRPDDGDRRVNGLESR